jgi:hypothetical protein
MLHTDIDGFLGSPLARSLKGRVQLVFTSPPFPLQRQKAYGNLSGKNYLRWLERCASGLGDLLAEDGSLVIEIGNAWEPGHPVMSTLPLESLLAFKRAGGFHLCQHFVAHNPARLPSPAQWVTVERVRLKDAFTNIWWLSPSDRPKADNRSVLVEYSASMQQLLRRQQYSGGDRPSQHRVGHESFLRDNGGAIPSNVLTASNTTSRDPYSRYCRERDLPVHPARMHPALAEFFIRLLTDVDDLVFDPFGGSNTTGAAAERLGRRWLTGEIDHRYALGSVGRFSVDLVAA